MHRRFVLLASLAAALSISAVSREAAADDDSTAMNANRGLKIGIGPELLLPLRKNGPIGVGLDLEARYGIKVGPLVLAPGGLLNGDLISKRFIGIAMPTFRVTLPVGPLAPFVVGGIGGGWITNPSESGLALLGGGGLMIHIGPIVAVGVEVTYRTITGTEYGGVSLGPAISLF